MKKILIMISALGGGGAERVAVLLANRLSEKHEVYLLPFSKCSRPYPVSRNVRLLDYALFDLREKKGPLRQTARKLISAVWIFGRLSRFRTGKQPDATLSLLLGPNLFNILAPGHGRKVLSERNNPKKKGRGRLTVSRIAYRFGDAVVFQTEAIRSMFPKSVQAKGVLLPNPVETECMALDRRKHRIVSAGRLVRQKNHALLLRAFSSFHRIHPEYELTIYGDGDLEKPLRAMIDELELTESVRLIPNSAHIHREIADAEFFVLSSDFEGLPNSLLEAMMMGIPCISTRYPGSEELLRDRETALLVPVGDTDALSGAMTRFAEDPLLRETVSKNGKLFAETYRAETVLPLWEKVIFGEPEEEKEQDTTERQTRGN